MAIDPVVAIGQCSDAAEILLLVPLRDDYLENLLDGVDNLKRAESLSQGHAEITTGDSDVEWINLESTYADPADQAKATLMAASLSNKGLAGLGQGQYNALATTAGLWFEDLTWFRKIESAVANPCSFSWSVAPRRLLPSKTLETREHTSRILSLTGSVLTATWRTELRQCDENGDGTSTGFDLGEHSVYLLNDPELSDWVKASITSNIPINTLFIDMPEKLQDELEDLVSDVMEARPVYGPDGRVGLQRYDWISVVKLALGTAKLVKRGFYGECITYGHNENDRWIADLKRLARIILAAIGEPGGKSR